MLRGRAVDVSSDGAPILFHTHTHTRLLLMSNSVRMRGVLLYIVPLGHWHMYIFYRRRGVYMWVYMRVCSVVCTDVCARAAVTR